MPDVRSAVIACGAGTKVADAAGLYGRYDGEVGGGTDNHAFNAGFRMR